MFAILPSLALALASEFISNENVLKYVGLAGEIVNQAFEVDSRLEGLNAHILQMVSEQRNPTEAEWATLTARSNVAHDTIQSWTASA